MAGDPTLEWGVRNGLLSRGFGEVISQELLASGHLTPVTGAMSILRSVGSRRHEAGVAVSAGDIVLDQWLSQAATPTFSCTNVSRQNTQDASRR